MLTVITLLTLGILLGFLLSNKEKIIGYVDQLTNWSIYLLLFLLGISVGVNEKIIKNFGEIGIKATILTAGAILGSVVISYFTYKLFLKK